MKKYLRVFYDFPIAMLASFLGMIIFILGINDKIKENLLIKSGFILCLSFFIFSIISIFFLEKDKENIKKITLNIIFLIILSIYSFILPENLSEINMLKFFIFIISSIIILVFIPLNRKYLEENKYINYFNNILKSFSLAFVYSLGIMFVFYVLLGVFSALFEINHSYKFYLNANTVIFSFIMPYLFFLFLDLKESLIYNKYTKIFIKYVLFALVSIFLIFLYSYFIKILITWKFPKNVISYLISSYTVLGILFMYISYELEEKYIKFYNKYFFHTLLPLDFMFLLAIYMRIKEYGITEDRFLLLLISIWILIVSIYKIMDKRFNLRKIPVSFLLFLFIALFSTRVSIISQKMRFESLIEKYKVESNQVKKEKLEKDLSSILDIFYKNYSLKTLNKDLEKLNLEEAANKYNFSYKNKYSYFDKKIKYININYSYNRNKIYNIKGYDYYIPTLYYHQKNSLEEIEGLKLILEKDNLALEEENEKIKLINLKEDLLKHLKTYVEEIKDSETYLEKDIYTEIDIKKYKIKINYINIYFQLTEENKIKNLSYDKMLLIKIK